MVLWPLGEEVVGLLGVEGRHDEVGGHRRRSSRAGRLEELQGRTRRRLILLRRYVRARGVGSRLGVVA